MPNSAVRSSSVSSLLFFTILLSLFTFSVTSKSAGQNQSPAKPLRASQLVALEAGGALQANIAHDIGVRGVNFHPDEEFLQMMTKAGADAGVIAALKSAKVDGDIKPDKQLVQALTDAAVLMKSEKNGEAGAKLSQALDNSFARMETGFAMAELMRREEKYDVAQSVYAEILETEPDFPEVHDKASYILYKLDDTEHAVNEANIALQENANDAEAHKNKGLALEQLGKFDAAITEYKEALRIKPDYAAVRYDLGLLYYNRHDYAHAIEEYKKSLAMDPKSTDAHNNLGQAYLETGNVALAIKEFGEAKRLAPDDPMYRQNLASAMMRQSPGQAILELRELEQKFPDFELCHICLGNALVWQGDTKGAKDEYSKAIQIDPGNPDGYEGLGRIQEQQKNLDGALQQYRAAERIFPNDASIHKDAGRVLLAKKDNGSALQELRRAEELSESEWDIHELYGKALEASGQNELAAAEFREAIALNPTEAILMTELGSALEKKGDWPGALEQYRKAVLADQNVKSHAVPGQAIQFCGPECTKAYAAAQGRFADHLLALKKAGKGAEAAELEKRVAQLDGAAGTKDKMQIAMHAGDQAFQLRNVEEAEKSYKEAVALAEDLPPSDGNLIVALGRLGNAYAMQSKYAEAGAAFHRQLAIAEKTFGPGSDKSVEPLRFLGQLAAFQKNYKEAESYLQRALDITLQATGDNNPRAVESLRGMAGLYMTEQDWPKAETYLLRAVKGAESSENDQMVLIPLWGLCDMYDRAGNPEKAQPCWHRATGILETQYGQNSPNLAESLNSEAAELRKLGRADEAQKIEERVANIKRTAQE